MSYELEFSTPAGLASALKFAAWDEVFVSPEAYHVGFFFDKIPRGVEARIEPNTRKNLMLVSLLFL